MDESKEKGTIRKKLLNAIRPALIWLVVLLVLVLIANVIIYNGFVNVPSSATYIQNFDDLNTVMTWTTFKTSYPALDPETLQMPVNQFLHQPNVVGLNVTSMNWWEEFTYPKGVLSLHVIVNAHLNNQWLKLPSFLVLLLDQTDRIRGKIYVQQGSEDFFLTGENRTELTFWFKIPSNMQDQNYRVIVELFGVLGVSRSVEYEKILTPDSFHGTAQPFMMNDDIYGTLPSWYYPNMDYRYLEFLAYAHTEAYIPRVVSVFSLALYSWTVTGVILAFSAFLVYARNKLVAYWKRNTPYIIFATLFVLFFSVLFILIVLTH